MPGNTAATVFIGNLDERVDEKILHGIMIQAGPLVDVHIIRDKESKKHKGYGFAEYATVESAEYAIRLFTGLLRLYGRFVNLAAAGGAKKEEEEVRAPVMDIPPAESNMAMWHSQQRASAGPHVWPSSANGQLGYGMYGGVSGHGYMPPAMYDAGALEQHLYYQDAATYAVSHSYQNQQHLSYPPN